MKYENFKVLAFELQNGLHKLLKYGIDTFELYADEIDMSYCDRNRVISKARMAYGKIDLKEIPCPPEMRQSRWDCYSNMFKYDRNKGLDLIKGIDSAYYGTQPIPSPQDVTNLTGSMLEGV